MSFGPPVPNLLVNYSATQQRARLVENDESEAEETSMPAKRKRRSKRLKKNKSIRKRSGRGGRRTVRVTKGRVAVRVPGFKGVQHLQASKLIGLFPVSKVRVAAKKFLNKSGKVSKRRRKKKGGRRKKRKN